MTCARRRTSNVECGLRAGICLTDLTLEVLALACQACVVSELLERIDDPTEGGVEAGVESIGYGVRAGNGWVTGMRATTTTSSVGVTVMLAVADVVFALAHRIRGEQVL